MDDGSSKSYVSAQRAPLIFLLLAVLALSPLLFQIMRPFLTPFILASILAIVVNPANKWMRSRIRRPSLAALVTTLAVGVVVEIIVVALGFALTHELTDAYDALSRRSLQEGGWAALVTNTADRVVEALATRLPALWFYSTNACSATPFPRPASTGSSPVILFCLRENPRPKAFAPAPPGFRTPYGPTDTCSIREHASVLDACPMREHQSAMLRNCSIPEQHAMLHAARAHCIV